MFKPIDLNTLIPDKRKKDMKRLLFLTDKRYGILKKVETVLMEAKNEDICPQMNIIVLQLLLNLYY